MGYNVWAAQYHATMKMTRNIFGLIIAVTLVLTGCAPASSNSDTIVEGVIFSVSYQMENGSIGGYTRVNDSSAIPGSGFGRYNTDAYGRLTREFLIITRPQRSDFGPQVIPVHRLVSIQFGDGGIKQVKESKPSS